MQKEIGIDFLFINLENHIHRAKYACIPLIQTCNRSDIDTGRVIGILSTGYDFIITEIATGDSPLKLIFREHETIIISDIENTINCRAAIPLRDLFSLVADMPSVVSVVCNQAIDKLSVPLFHDHNQTLGLFNGYVPDIK